MITSVILANPLVTADITSKSLLSCPQVRPSLYRHHLRLVRKLLLSSPTRPFFTIPTSSQSVRKLLLSSPQMRPSLYRHHRSVPKLLLSSPQMRPSLYRHHRSVRKLPLLSPLSLSHYTDIITDQSMIVNHFCHPHKSHRHYRHHHRSVRSYHRHRKSVR